MTPTQEPRLRQSECPVCASGDVEHDRERGMDLPQRIVVGANGAYWRDYGDHYSMPPISEDNDPVVPAAVYIHAAEAAPSPDGALRAAAVAVCQLWFTDNAPEGSQHVRKAMLDLRAALEEAR